MLFRIYNQNGKVRITKTMNDMEQIMFHDVPKGFVVEIEVGSDLWTKGHAKPTGSRKDPAADPVSIENPSLN